MKQFFFLLLLVCSLVASAQSPQGISYQAVATDVQGAPLDNQVIVVRFSILEAAPTGAAVYIETHNTSTDPYGMFNLNLGMGIHEGGAASSLAEVNWGLAAHFLKVELDIEGDGGFVSMGTQQMMSVPYALYAEQAGNAGDDQDQDPTNELQTLSLLGDTLSLSNGGEVVLDSGTESQSAPQFSIECVDMGVSVMCGGLGLTSDAPLGPGYTWLSSDGTVYIYDGDGYKYYLTGYDDLNYDNYFNRPHWRKFQIHGLTEALSPTVTIKYFSQQGNVYWYTMTPEFDESGDAFVYFFAGSSDECLGSDDIFLSIPEAHSQSVQNGDGNPYWNNLSFYYSDGQGLRDMGILIDFE